MYVCICMAVTDREIHQAIDGGARSLRDLRNHLGITSQCGRCATCAHGLLKQASVSPSRGGEYRTLLLNQRETQP